MWEGNRILMRAIQIVAFLQVRSAILPLALFALMIRYNTKHLFLKPSSRYTGLHLLCLKYSILDHRDRYEVFSMSSSPSIALDLPIPPILLPGLSICRLCSG